MWTVANTTPYVVESEVLRDRSGAETLVVVVKGTFIVRTDGQCDVDDEQVTIVRVPQFIGPPGQSSLLCDSDFVIVKPTTDVLVYGHAYAGPGTGGKSVVVKMEVGPVTKRLRVWGDRHWQWAALRWSATDPLPFERMPIVYERAFGGSIGAPGADGIWRCDPRNPVGRGFGGGDHRKEGDPLPNVEYDDARKLPAGLGAISRHWSPRLELAGTYDTAWRENRFPLPPDDFDARFYNAAPPDQQPERHLVGGESVSLENLNPNGSLRFALPRVWLALNAQIGTDVEALRTELHTVLFRPDERRVVMTWVSTFRCQGRTTKLRLIHVREKPRVALSTAARAEGGR